MALAEPAVRPLGDPLLVLPRGVMAPLPDGEPSEVSVCPHSFHPTQKDSVSVQRVIHNTSWD